MACASLHPPHLAAPGRTAALSGILEYTFAPSGDAVLFPLSGRLYYYPLAKLKGKKPAVEFIDTHGFATDATVSPAGGHVAYVMAVDTAGNAIVEEYNWSNYLRYGQRTVRAPRYIHFVGAAVQPVSNPAPTQPARGTGHSYYTTDTVRQRFGPGTGYPVLGIVPVGHRIVVVCQIRSGSVVNGTAIWDRLSDGSYVTDYYTTTPAFNRMSPGLSSC